MIPFLVEMKKIHDQTECDPAWQNDAFDPPTISWNIGINDHSPAVNITPAESVCTVYFRPMPGQDPDVLIERARDAATRCGVELELMHTAPPLYIEPSSEFVREMLELTGNPQPQTVSYGTDGCMLTELQNLVVLGPGDISQAHTSNEWISLDELRRGTELYARLIEYWCCEKRGGRHE
jgi:acetylornithine deacetylase